MMYREIHKRHKWKRKALIGLYLIFILANIGEIFLTLNRIEEARIKHVEVQETLKIPIHLPEETTFEFVRVERLSKFKN